MDIDDPQWDELLDEMSVDDMVQLTSLAGYQTPAVESIGKVQVTDADGPAAINNNFTGDGSIGFGVATPPPSTTTSPATARSVSAWPRSSR